MKRSKGPTDRPTDFADRLRALTRYSRMSRRPAIANYTRAPKMWPGYQIGLELPLGLRLPLMLMYAVTP